MEQPIQPRKSDLVLINKKKISFQLVDFVVAADHGVKIKENENFWTLLES